MYANLFKRIPWARVGGEAAIIVASILLAFWIDAWWQQRSERIVEQEYLAALLVEIDAVIAEVDRTLAENEQLNETGIGRAAGWRSGWVPDGEALRIMLEDTWVSYRLRAGLDTWSELLSSGSVTILRDPEVRQALARLRTVMDFEQETFQVVITRGTQLRPLLLQAIDSGQFGLVARIEEDLVATRKVHDDRKREVRLAALDARASVIAATSRGRA